MGFTREKATNVLTSTIKSTHYVGLSTTTPTADGGNFTEPSGMGYARAPIGEINSTKFKAQIANSGIIFFNETLGNWGNITHFGLFENESGGAPYFTGELTAPVQIVGVTTDNTYIPIFRAAALIIGMDKDSLETAY